MGWVSESMDSIRSLQIRHVLTQIVSLGMIVTSALIIWKGLMCVTGSESPVVVVLSGSMEPGFKRGDILFLHMSKDPIRAGEIVVFNVDGRKIPIVHRVIKSIISLKTILGFPNGQSFLLSNKRLIPVRFPQALEVQRQTQIQCWEFMHLAAQQISTSGKIIFIYVHSTNDTLINVDGNSRNQLRTIEQNFEVHERQDTGEVDVLTKGDNNFGDDRLLYAHGQLWLQQHHIMGRAVGFLPYVGWVTIIMTEKPIIKYILIGALGLLVITSKE